MSVLDGLLLRLMILQTEGDCSLLIRGRTSGVFDQRRFARVFADGTKLQ